MAIRSRSSPSTWGRRWIGASASGGVVTSGRKQPDAGGTGSRPKVSPISGASSSRSWPASRAGTRADPRVEGPDRSEAGARGDLATLAGLAQHVVDHDHRLGLAPLTEGLDPPAGLTRLEGWPPLTSSRRGRA